MNSPIGFLNINKPAGMTSRDVVNLVQKATGVRRCGHAGTLDPMATGVLVVGVGSATRLISYVQQMRKTYHAEFRFGQHSDTDDIEGNVTAGNLGKIPSQQELLQALQGYLGEIEQVPPQYSAVMVKGKRAYDLARQGKQVDLKAREITIYDIQLTEFAAPDWSVDVECGSGTYIRSLGRDVGQQFGCGAVMNSLVRSRIGCFSQDDAVVLDDLNTGNWQQYLVPPAAAISELYARECSAEEATALRNGKYLPAEVPAEEIGLIDQDQQLIGVGKYDAERQLIKPHIVLSR